MEVACRLNRARWDVHVSCVRAVGPLRTKLEAAGVQAWSCGRGSLKLPRSLAWRSWGLVRYLRTHSIRLVHSFDFYQQYSWRSRGAPRASPRSDREPTGPWAIFRPGLQGRVHRLVLRWPTTSLSTRRQSLNG